MGTTPHRAPEPRPTWSPALSSSFVLTISGPHLDHVTILPIFQKDHRSEGGGFPNGQGHDAAEDEEFGEDHRGNELQPELATKEGRLAKLRAAKEAIEAEAKDKAAPKAPASARTTSAAVASMRSRAKTKQSQSSTWGSSRSSRTARLRG